MSYFDFKYPLEEEFLTCDFYCITDKEEWLPYDQSDLTSHLIPVKFSDDEIKIPSDERNNEHLIGLDWYNERANSIKIKEIEHENKSSFISTYDTNKKDKLTLMKLSKLRSIGVNTAERTLHATTHDCIRTLGTLERRFRTDRVYMHYKC